MLMRASVQQKELQAVQQAVETAYHEADQCPANGLQAGITEI